MQPYSSERYVLPKRIGDIAIPDSRLSFDAFDVAKSHVSIEVLLHSIRAFAFAALIGKARGVRFDPELLFVSGILHDVGPRNIRHRIIGLKWMARTPRAN